jgi:hypothetical protein
MTKIDRVRFALVNEGRNLTAKQLASMFGFSSPNAARAAVSDLRLNHGFSIYSNKKTDTKGRVKYKYRFGTASRAVVAAGYRALAAQRAA